MTTGEGVAAPPQTSAAPPDAGDARRKARLAFLVISAGFFLAQLDTLIVNVALPTINQEFHGSTLSGLSWTLNGYAIVLAALMVPAGRWADRIGRKNVFLIGVALFTVASLLCGIATNVPFLVAARVLQAMGAAALVPTSLGLLLASAPPEGRAKAVSAWAAIGGSAPAFGSLVGGVLLQADWRWLFFINLPVGIFALVAGLRALPTEEKPEQGPFPDAFGALLLMISISAVTLALVKAPEWSAGQIAGLFVFAAVVLGWFVFRCSRHESPLIDLSLLRVPAFMMANISALLYSISFAALVFSFMQWCQDVWGWSGVRTGMALLPGLAIVPVAARLAAPVVKRIGAASAVATGSGAMTVGVVWWIATAELQPEYVKVLLPGVLLFGAGSALAITALMNAATAGLAPTAFATGSAIVNMVRQLGMALGVSLFIALLGTPDTPEEARTAFDHGWILTAAAGGVAAVVSLALGLWLRFAAAKKAEPVAA
ncbi:MFS transporter [Streptomyces sp. NBC_01304]|uniref:MFS transporter n=1 Tax=Streptomyces sp. NBC_01304 TaxID=2903818 RepID=UPI002E0F681B|nr:MFS transporter [Streptomyces sp. NBC_01304]